MNLTVCLVTKGRKQFIDQSMASLEKAMRHPKVSVWVFDNGCPREISSLWREWCAQKNVKFTRYNENNCDINRIWNELREGGCDWIVFPGDDDVVIPEIFDEWWRIIHSSPQIVAFAGSIQKIDLNGRPWGEKRTSACHGLPRATALANSLHQPPFWWPAFLFRLSVLPDQVPSSCYVLDWWVQMYLLSMGEVHTSEKIAALYRIHQDQTGFLGHSQRKYLEAEFWLSQLVESEKWQLAIKSLDDSERDLFYEELKVHPPIYGDATYSRTLFLICLKHLMRSYKNEKSIMRMLGDYAILNGVVLKNGEIRTFVQTKEMKKDTDSSNVFVIALENTCKVLTDCLADFSNDKDKFSIAIGCQHSLKCEEQMTNNCVILDCVKFNLYPADSRSSLVIVEVTEILEQKGPFSYKLTLREKKVLAKLRKMYINTPALFRILIRKFI